MRVALRAGRLARRTLLALSTVGLFGTTAAYAAEARPEPAAGAPSPAPELAAAAATTTSSPSGPEAPSGSKGHGAKPKAADPFRHGDWPFRPPERPAIPQVSRLGWVKNPIDAFILAKLEEHGLQPAPEADRRTLLRRVTFDLTGLPPTAEELAAFEADRAPGAYERVVERLLASPHYGERWAQHWLDLVRYAETDGFNQDAHRENAYRYRDYVIRAFDEDLPYDRFIAQQLAGDELEPHNPLALVATGLNRLYPDEYNAADLRLRRQEILDDITDTTGLVFLGLTMGCAQCHDHKFDEILQADYFRLQAFFQPMLPRDDLVVATPAELEAHRQQQARWEEATRAVRAEIDALLDKPRQKILLGTIDKYDEEIRQAILTPDAERTSYQKQLVYQARKYYEPKLEGLEKQLKGEDRARYDALLKELASFDHLRPAPLPRAMGITDAGPDAPPTFRLATGNVRKPLDRVEPGFPEFLGGDAVSLVPVKTDGGVSTGRRAALATWLTRRDHPLTSRVMINRVWQHHFGEGIVPSSNDFGAMGDPPSHAELLDWLALEFVDSGWSFKHMHRLMVTSAAYRQSSVIDADDPRVVAARKADPANRMLWHFRRKRLEAEAIRDAMLAISGELNPRRFGPSAKPDLPAGVSSQAWKPDADRREQNRRSIYVLAKRNLRYPMFDAFDQPDLHHSCARRSTTTTAPQALLMFNSEFTLEQAQHWAGRLLREAGKGDEDALVRAAYVAAFGREPTSEEEVAVREFLDRQADSVERLGEPLDKLPQPTPRPAGLSAARGAAMVDFCHALLNANEFLYID